MHNININILQYFTPMMFISLLFLHITKLLILVGFTTTLLYLIAKPKIYKILEWPPQPDPWP